MRSCLLCDDHALVREALVGTVRLIWPDARTTEASTFPEAWEQARLAPDLVLADLLMPGADPREGIDGIMTAAPAARVLVITGNQDDQLMIDLLKRGVAGFAPKAASSAIIEAALRLIAAGGVYLPPRLAELATRDGGWERPSPIPGATAEQMTARQLEILQLITLGKSNKEIARSLDLAPSTVKSHVSQILARLGAVNRTDALARAKGLNLL